MTSLYSSGNNMDEGKKLPAKFKRRVKSTKKNTTMETSQNNVSSSHSDSDTGNEVTVTVSIVQTPYVELGNFVCYIFPPFR